MNKTYKGWELIKAINDSEIKSGTQIKVHRTTENKSFTADYWFWGNWFGKEDGYSKPIDNIELYLCDNDNTFEVIEDEIDIDSITEKEWMTASERNFKINQLVQAIKQINKEVKKLKEDNKNG